MDRAPENQAPLAGKRYSILILMVLVAAGLAGNYFKFELFFNIQFIFGSIFALLALRTLGFGPGILAGVLISSMTYFLWNHPYSMIIMTCEVISVGWLTRRKGFGLVLADALFWLCLGMPLAYIFHYDLMHLPLDNVLIIMVKQALNGIGNALLAGMIFISLSAFSRQRTFSFREVIFHLLAFFVFGPSLFFLTLECRTDLASINQEIRTSLLHSSSRTAHDLELWLGRHLALIAHLANMATMNTPSSLQRGIEEIHSGNQDFLRVGLLDQNATVVAFSPLLDEFGQPNLGRNFSDRPFIPLLKKTLRPMFSEVVMGRINTPEPVVSILAPVVKNEGYEGYAIGVLNLEGLLEVMGFETTAQNMHYTLLDRNGKVIISNRQGLESMEAFAFEPGDLQLLDHEIGRLLPRAEENISISARWQNSSYIKETTIGSMAEWKLILEQPLAPFQEKLFQEYSRKLAVLLLVLFLALILAELCSRQLIITLAKLNVLTTDLPAKLLSGQDIAWPESMIRETARLLTNIKGMALALSEKFQKINELNANLEGRVQERTAELNVINAALAAEISERKLAEKALHDAKVRLEKTFSSLNEAIFLVETASRTILDCNQTCESMFGYSREEMLGANTAILHISEEMSQRFGREMRQAYAEKGRYETIFVMKRKDGSIFDSEHSVTPIQDVLGEIIHHVCVVRDISERKRAEERTLRSLKEKEVMLKEIHHRVKNNMQVVYSLLNLQAKSIEDPAIRAMFEESRNRVSSMALIHERLYRSDDLAFIDFKEYLQRLVAGIADTYNRRDVDFVVQMEPLALDVNIGIPCGLIVNELASNSLKHAFPEGRKGRITLGINTNSAGMNVLTVEDNGIGFPAALDFKNTQSLGMQLVMVLTGQLNGTIELGQVAGTKFTITFPGC